MTGTDDFAQKAAGGRPETASSAAHDAKKRRIGKPGFMSNTRIGVRIAMIVALPLAVAAALGTQTIIQEFASQKADEKVVNLTEVSTFVSNAVDNLQSERDLTAMFVATKGENFADRLKAQRLETDKSLAELKDMIAATEPAKVTEKFATLLKALPEKLSALAAHR